MYLGALNISKSFCTDRECRAHAVSVGGHLPAQVGAVVHHRLVVEPEDVGRRLRGLDIVDKVDIVSRYPVPSAASS